MVAPRRTRRVLCTVIQVPVNEIGELQTTDRPSNRLPWSDPTIARLVANLQDEVRLERRQTKLARRTKGNPVADLDPPTPVWDDEWQWQEEPRWTWPD